MSELSRRVEQLGYMLHVFSAFECKRTTQDATPFVRGVNSIHLLYDKTRYWVLTVLGDAERLDDPLPVFERGFLVVIGKPTNEALRSHRRFYTAL